MRHLPDPFDTPVEASYAAREITRHADAREDATTDATYDHNMPGADPCGWGDVLHDLLNNRRTA